MNRNRRLISRARRVIPGGVNSPVRAFGAVGGTPPFIVSGNGAIVTDADGKKYIDYLASWGPLILGHAHPVVLKAVRKALARGTTFGAATEREIELAELIRECIPSMEQVRLVSSGTEALMSAIRLARAYTHRNGIIKFTGGYHGHADSFLVAAGSGAATFGHPSSPGVPPELARLTTVLPYNDARAVLSCLSKKGSSIAAVVVEPVSANAGVIAPKAGFLEALRIGTRKCGALLLFDEVVTGFRVGIGGAQEMFGVTPDITCVGKIVGGGLPLAAFGGPRKIMRILSPEGPVYQAGTLSGNPLAVAAGIAVLQYLRTHSPYANLESLAAVLAGGLSDAFHGARVPHRINRVGSMMTVFFTEREVGSFEEAKLSDTRRFARFHQAMMSRGVYLPPAQFEAFFVSTAHTLRLIDETLNRAMRAVKSI